MQERKQMEEEVRASWACIHTGGGGGMQGWGAVWCRGANRWRRRSCRPHRPAFIPGGAGHAGVRGRLVQERKQTEEEVGV